MAQNPDNLLHLISILIPKQAISKGLAAKQAKNQVYTGVGMVCVLAIMLISSISS